MTHTGEADVATWLAESSRWIDDELRALLPAEDAHPALLHRAMRYAVFGGGKRIRPALARLFCLELGGELEHVVPYAAALELVHTYSLVHDDLPCMDDDALRRGRPTVHVAFDEATAVLVGDGLQALAFELVARGPATATAEAVGVLARAVGSLGMVGGQVLDLAATHEAMGGAPVTNALEGVRDVHSRKTAALFAASAELGVLAASPGRASAQVMEQRTRARRYGSALGLCFQATDDVLDVTGDADTLGKTPGKDAALERGTLVALLGVEGAAREARQQADQAHGAARELAWDEASLARRLIDFVLQREA